MKQIWAPWRISYIKGKKAGGCFFCQGQEKGPGPISLILCQTPHTIVLMNRYPYAAGHLMVAPRRHVCRLWMLGSEESMELHKTLVRTSAILEEALACEGMNIGLNLGKAGGAGFEEHIHYHLVPRWIGDTNFMTTCARTRVIPQDLSSLYSFLFPLFSSEQNNESLTPSPG